MRNMLVHRGRRMNPVYVEAVAARLVVPSGRSVRVVHLLPKDPARQEVEVLREGEAPYDGQLQEHSEETVAGIYDSIRTLVEVTSSELLALWRFRRENADAIPQPLDAQWPSLEPSDSTGFEGYNPGSAQLGDVGILALNPQAGRRLLAAALDDANRYRWASFD
jgi:hypothetical protein